MSANLSTASACLDATPTAPVLPASAAPSVHQRPLRITPKYGAGARNVRVRYLDAGAADAAVIVVQGGISADHNAAQWWHELVGHGKAIDLRQSRVVAIDWLDARTLGAAAVSSEDQADALAALLDALDIKRIAGFVGASYGAMVGLAFAARHAQRLDQLLVLAGAHRPHPLATAQRAVQRGIVRLGLQHGCVDQSLSLARQLAMTTYRDGAELARRFGGGAELQDGRFRLPIEDWLEYAGEHFAARFDPQRYLELSESIDLHDIDPAAIHTHATLIGFTSDRLVPLADLCELQQRLGHGATLEVVDSAFGHDGFLKEHEALAPLLRAALPTSTASRTRSHA